MVRKPFAVLSGEMMQGMVQDAVVSGKVSLLVLFSFSEMDAMEVMNQFLSPFNITTTDVMVWDEESNFNNTKKLVLFRKEAGALQHDQLFQGVEKLLVPQPHHLVVEPPAIPILVGNPTSVANRFYEAPGEQMDGDTCIFTFIFFP